MNWRHWWRFFIVFIDSASAKHDMYIRDEFWGKDLFLSEALIFFVNVSCVRKGHTKLGKNEIELQWRNPGIVIKVHCQTSTCSKCNWWRNAEERVTNASKAEKGRREIILENKRIYFTTAFKDFWNKTIIVSKFKHRTSCHQMEKWPKLGATKFVPSNETERNWCQQRETNVIIFLFSTPHGPRWQTLWTKLESSLQAPCVINTKPRVWRCHNFSSRYKCRL